MTVSPFAPAATPPTGTWYIDPLHSSVGFVARHLGFVRVRGRFTDVEGTVRITDPVEDSSVEVRIATATVDTGVPMRDRHLRSHEFLGSERHPVMEFRGHSVRRQAGHWSMEGDLTIAGRTRPVTLTGDFLGEDVFPFTGGRRLGFTAHTRLDRREFGVSGLPPAPGAEIFVGAEVDIELEISMIEHDIRAMAEQTLGRPLAL
ncbi:YceI family protein [Streptomyces sp. MI02-7b]|uniref:YceI family protein n=1 Tax=Streptomyces sp. MI02-7b TaxID=462941 RepID=UPI0029AE0CC0|nr:YceI family protein [Streptomyces sp. MI02-7b]MDX3077880.1 YceI family protein [Streptomyces sp. MI02-7b]